MTISILTLFPEIFLTTLSYSIIGRAALKKLVNFRLINIRDFAESIHKSVDDKPYGGGTGMLMRVDVVERAISSAKCKVQSAKFSEKIVLLDPAGPVFTQSTARRYEKLDHLILVCGHYEGIDARISNFVDESISIGKYIITGGETASQVIIEAVTRLIPGVLKKEAASQYESFSQSGYLEYWQYTRPPVYKGYRVPKILLSGNHLKINRWRDKQAGLRLRKTSSE